MNRKQQGDVGVAAAVFYYTKAGCTVSLPATDNARYDLICDDGNSLQRVQCKTTGFKTRNSIYQVQLCTNGGNKTSTSLKLISTDECDTIFVYVLDGTMYEFPVSFCAGRRRMNLGKLCEQYKCVG